MPLGNLGVSQSTAFPWRGKNHSKALVAHSSTTLLQVFWPFLSPSGHECLSGHLLLCPWPCQTHSTSAWGQPFQISSEDLPFSLFFSFCGGSSQWELKHSEHSWKSHVKQLSASGGGQPTGSGYYRMEINWSYLLPVLCLSLPFSRTSCLWGFCCGTP